MSDWISLLNDVAVGVFGCILSVFFSGSADSRRKQKGGMLLCWCGIGVILLLQGGCYLIWGSEVLRRLYPIVMHLPLILLLWFVTKKPLWSVVSVLSAYLCCQLRRWLALLVVTIASGGPVLQDVAELCCTVPLLIFLLWVIAPAFRRLAEHPVRMQLQFGAIPALFYVFDYVAVVYTDLLLDGPAVIVEFMPFICCICYLFFLVYNAAAERKNSRMQQLQKGLDTQLKQAVREISALQESQAMARRYRHDLRHHLHYVSACIENGQTEQAQSYISEICEQMDSQKVERYCENETANLILSAFAGRAKSEGIAINVEGALPAFIKVSSSDLCVLLSNALENALHACQPIAAKGESCCIEVNFYEWDNNFFLQVINPCTGKVRFEKGIPVSDRPDHGIGVQSICAIVKRYRGVYSFSVQDGKFTMRLSV